MNGFTALAHNTEKEKTVRLELLLPSCHHIEQKNKTQTQRQAKAKDREKLNPRAVVWSAIKLQPEQVALSQEPPLPLFADEFLPLGKRPK